MQTRIRSLVTATLAGCLLVGLTAMAGAADVSGKWTWSGGGRAGGGTGTGTATPRVTTLTLKVEGGKLTGTVSNPGRAGAEPTPAAISDGKIDGDKISFAVVREGRNGNKTTTKYSATVTGDTLKGKIEMDRNGTPTSRDWEAKKAK